MLFSPSRGHIRSYDVRARCERSYRAAACCLVARTSPPAPLVDDLFRGVEPDTAVRWLRTFGRRHAAEQVAARSRALAPRCCCNGNGHSGHRPKTCLHRQLKASPEDADAHRHLAEALWHRGSHGRSAMCRWPRRYGCDPTDAVLLARAGEMALAAGRTRWRLPAAKRQFVSIRSWRWAGPFEAASFGGWISRTGPWPICSGPWSFHRRMPTCSSIWQSCTANADNRPAHSPRCTTLLDTYPPGEEPQMALLLEGQTLMALGRPHQAAESLTGGVASGPPNAEMLLPPGAGTIKRRSVCGGQ